MTQKRFFRIDAELNPGELIPILISDADEDELTDDEVIALLNRDDGHGFMLFCSPTEKACKQMLELINRLIEQDENFTWENEERARSRVNNVMASL